MKKIEQQEQQIYIVDQDEETSGSSVSFMDFLRVLFGRKILLAIVTVSLFAISTLAILLLNNQMSTYVGSFDYNTQNFSNGSYLDGSRFDIRDSITLEKLNQYKSEHNELKNLNMEKVHNGNGIVSLTHEVRYEENKEKQSEEDSNYIRIDDGYKIVLRNAYFSGTQARVLVEAIANDAVMTSKGIVENSNYSQYLTFYEKSSIYDRQIDYLNQQYRLLDSKYDTLLSLYGDATLNDGKRVSDARVALKEYFQSEIFVSTQVETKKNNDDADKGQSAFLASLKSELDHNGYVKDYTGYDTQLEKQVDSLTREKNVVDAKKQELVNQRDALLNGAGSLNTVEIAAYNDAIIELSNQVIDLNEQITLINLKINNKGREKTDPAYAADLKAFGEKLEKCYNSLKEMTEEYQTIEKEVVNNKTVVYFASNSVVEKENALKIYFLIPIALVGSFVVALFVNLCVDGKKLSAKYREKEKEPKEIKE